MEQNDIITIKELAEIWNLRPTHIRKLAREGKIPGVKAGMFWRFSRTEVLEAFRNLNKHRSV